MKKKKLNLMELGSILDRSEMKKIMAGSGGCGPWCSGCISDNTSNGFCVLWECRDGDWCVPVSSFCCVV